MGFFSSKKTFTSLSVVDLYDKDYQFTNYKKQLAFSDLKLGDYNMSIWSFKHGYRTRYTKEFLEKYGFGCNENGYKYIPDYSKISEKIKDFFGHDVYEIMSVNVDSSNIVKITMFELYKIYGDNLNISEQTLKTRYYGSNSDDLCCSGEIGVYDCECCDDNDDCSNDNCDDDDEPRCAVLYNNFNVFYTNEDDDPDTDDDLDEITIQMSNFDNDNIYSYNRAITNKFTDVSMYVSYKRSGSDRLYYYIETFDTAISYYEKYELSMSAIIPLKEENEIETDDKGIKKLLRKFHLHPNDLQESLENPDLDAMYLLTGIEIRDIYKYEPKVYKADNVENFPPNLIRKMDEKDDGTEFTLTEEVASWWHHKNRRKTWKYANMVHDVLLYYGNGELFTEMRGLKIRTTIDMSVSLKDGVLDTKKDGSTRTSYGEILVNEPIVVEKDYYFFVEMCQSSNLWIYSSNGSCSPFFNGYNSKFIDNYEYSYSYSDVMDIKDGGTLPVIEFCTVIRVQKNEDSYSEILLHNLNQKVYISGEWFKIRIDGSWHSSSDGEDDGAVGSMYPRLVYPLELLNDLDFQSYSIAKEYGTVFYAYAEKTVKTSWWQKLVGLVISIVLCIASAGAACGIATLIINFVVAYAIGFVISKIASLIDSPILSAIFQFAAKLIMAIHGDLTQLADIVTENFLELATQAISLGTNALKEIEYKEIIEQRERDSLLQSADNVDKMLESTSFIPKMSISANISALDSLSLDAQIYSLYGKPYSYEQLFDADSALNMRLNVVAG